MNKRCINPGCDCRDARILNTRIARFVHARRPDAVPFRDPATLERLTLPEFNPDLSETIEHRLNAIAFGNL